MRCASERAAGAARLPVARSLAFVRVARLCALGLRQVAYALGLRQVALAFRPAPAPAAPGLFVPGPFPGRTAPRDGLRFGMIFGPFPASDCPSEWSERKCWKIDPNADLTRLV